MGGIEAEAPPRRRDARAVGGLLWATLVPLLLLLHPYGGLMQDARIYIGRGLADHDPSGIGRDMMFAHDEQTGFSAMRAIVDVLLRVASPGTVSLVLALLGGLLWLAGAAALFRSLARGRVAWAAVACALILPATYGAWGVFRYVEAIATPRVFAQAAVLGGLAALTGGRRALGAGLLVLAAVFHPLIALPGLAVGAAMLVRAGRGWIIAAVLAGAGVLAAAALGLPVLGRLAQPMDATWFTILRARSTYLFPSLWPASCFGPIVGQATTLAVAAVLAAPRLRGFLCAVLAVGLGGLALSWLFGDRFAMTLIVQVQPWRSLWLLALVGNAALALAAAALWERGDGGRVILAALISARLCEADLPVAGVLAALTLALLAAMSRGAMPRVSKLVLLCAGAATGALALQSLIAAAAAEATLLHSAQAEGGQASLSMIVGLGVQAVPLAAGALAVALVPAWRPGRVVRGAGGAAVLCGLAAAIWLWDARPPERRSVDEAPGDPALRAAVGSSPGEVLWLDEDSENWFLLGRPAFLNGAQAGPILFSRDLALEWADRAALLLRLGLARREDVAPWDDPHPTAADLAPRPEAVRLFCADGRHPAAVVAPGDQRGSVPAGLEGVLWRPPVPVRRLVIGDDALHWRVTDVFTVIRCPEPGPVGIPADRGARSGDAGSLG